MKEKLSRHIQPQSSAPFARSALGQSLAQTLQSGSASQRRLSEFVLRHPMRAASGSIDDLAKISGISAPTISRFARELGFGGFPEMRSAIAEAMQSLFDPVAKLRAQLGAGQDVASSASLLEMPARQLQGLDQPRLSEDIAAIAMALPKARAVHVMGFGLSAHVAALLVLGLQPFVPQVSGVVEFGGTEVAAGRLMGIGPGDMLIAITFPRYASDVVRLARYARDRGAEVIALTDSIASPLVPTASRVLYAPAEHPTLSASMVAAVAIVETLVASVMLSDPANAGRAALLGEAISGYLHEGS